MSEKKSIQRIDGDLHTVHKTQSDSGEVFHHVTRLHVETKVRDIAQIVAGACILGIPVAMTEEVWSLGKTMELWRILVILVFSIFVLGAFIYGQFYRGHFRKFRKEFFRRVVVAYGITFFVSALLLWLFDAFQLSDEPLLALKRTVIVTFPASFLATVVDSIN